MSWMKIFTFIHVGPIVPTLSETEIEICILSKQKLIAHKLVNYLPMH
jgi:hypothetical protein